jgi:hypothetical protein
MDGLWTPAHSAGTADSVAELLCGNRYGALRLNAIMARRRAAQPSPTERTCPQCSRTLPLDADHFYVDKRAPDGSVVKFARWCKECKRAYQSVGKFAAKDLGRRREQHRKLMEAAKDDPELMARIRAERARRGRECRASNPERVRAAQRRYREKLKADPERLRAQRESRRIAERLRRERQGKPLKPTRWKEAERDEHRHAISPVPAKPLAEALERRMVRMLHEANTGGDSGVSRESIAESWGASERSIRAWREGEREKVQFNVADRLLVATGLLPWDVWDDPDVLALWG